jgi:hypothetical protein
MRQYRILFKPVAGREFAVLEPNINSAVYDNPSVNAAIDAIRLNSSFAAIAVQTEKGLFNIVSFDQPAHAPNAFVLGEAA